MYRIKETGTISVDDIYRETFDPALMDYTKLEENDVTR